MAALVLPLWACDPGDVALLAPAASDSTPNLTLRAVIDTPHIAVAESLGWTSGVPGTQVRVHRLDESYAEAFWHSATTDSLGLASFADLLDGQYELEAKRGLTADEVAQTEDSTRLVAGGRRVYLPSTAVLDVTMAPDVRGSLVFSEHQFNQAAYSFEAGGVSADAKYFEIYNNSGTTIYLDGKYWGIGWHLNMDYPYWPCAETGIVRNDPEGIWSERIFRFPGRGADYPLAPGQTALIAKLAANFGTVDPVLPDLSHADFEWGRGSDNPDVPNLQDIGLRPMVPDWPWGSQPQFLSEPVDLATLPRHVDPYTGYTWVRIPRPLVLDATLSTSDQTTSPSGADALPACLEAVHRYFERLPGPAGAFRDFYDGLSTQRRVLMVLSDGRKVLQDTNTSMVDFVKAPRTPGWIP